MHSTNYIRHYGHACICYASRIGFYWGQGANTCACNSLKTVDEKIKASTEKYHRAHGALLALSLLLRKAGWMTKLWPLNNKDI